MTFGHQHHQLGSIFFVKEGIALTLHQVQLKAWKAVIAEGDSKLPLHSELLLLGTFYQNLEDAGRVCGAGSSGQWPLTLLNCDQDTDMPL